MASLQTPAIPSASLRAEQLCKSIAFLDRRIERTDARVIRLHGGRKCGKHFWCGGYCDRVKELIEIKEAQEAELEHALALMAAERLVGEGLNDDVLRMIVGYAVTTPIEIEYEMHSQFFLSNYMGGASVGE